MSWGDVFDRLNKLSRRIGNSRWGGRVLRVYGIPRGGAIVAGLLQARYGGVFCAIETESRSLETPDLIVDDLLDSGETIRRHTDRWPGVPFGVLVDKPAEGWAGRWIEFPWEVEPEQNAVSGPTDAVRRILEFVGEDPDREGLARTPSRVIRAYKEMTSGYTEDPMSLLQTVFTERMDELVLLQGIRFVSLCEHHLMPFVGQAHVGYIPQGKVVGLSKLARLVEVFSRRLQVQERLTVQIAEAISEALQPQGVGVVLEAAHACMGCRGVRQPDSRMVTSCLLGCLKTEPSARSEFMRLIGK